MPVHDPKQFQLPINDASITFKVDAVTDANAIAGLASVQGIGITTLRRIIADCGVAAGWFELGPSEALATLQRANPRITSGTAEALVQERDAVLSRGRKINSSLQSDGIHLLSPASPHFPAQLREIDTPPCWLYVQGDLDLLKRSDLVAVVGTRKPSQMGVTLAQKVALWLTRRGLGVVSGLAEGIDAAAQEAAVDSGAASVAVLGHGIDVVFPASTARLRENLLRAGGAVVTEYFPDERYSAERFIARNRIQAALSAAVFGIEAKVPSGTTTTLRFARALGRPIYGVRSNGSWESEIHTLIRELGGEVLDLNDGRTNGYLAEALTELVHRPVPTEAPPASNGLVLSRLVAEFRDILDRYQLSEHDISTFLHALTSAASARNGATHDH